MNEPRPYPVFTKDGRLYEGVCALSQVDEDPRGARQSARVSATCLLKDLS